MGVIGISQQLFVKYKYFALLLNHLFENTKSPFDILLYSKKIDRVINNSNTTYNNSDVASYYLNFYHWNYCSFGTNGTHTLLYNGHVWNEQFCFKSRNTITMIVEDNNKTLRFVKNGSIPIGNDCGYKQDGLLFYGLLVTRL